MSDLAHIKELARITASSSLVPKQYNGKPQDCFIAMQAANRLGCDPMLFMQNTYVLHGKPAMSAKFQIALANASKRIRGGIRWNITKKGDYTCEATCAETGEILKGPIVNMEMAKAENWTKNSKYRTMGDLMLRYRAATIFISLYLPEVTMGFQSAEEIADIHAAGMQDTVTELPPDLQPEGRALPTPEKPAEIEDLPEPARKVAEDMMAAMEEVDSTPEPAQADQPDLI